MLTFQSKSDRNKKKQDRCRECRSGCGVESSHDSCETPGWEVSEIDYISHDRKRDIKFLKLKRTEQRMKQTSTLMLIPIPINTENVKGVRMHHNLILITTYIIFFGVINICLSTFSWCVVVQETRLK